MFKFDNDHIFTGYLKQMLAAFNLPKFHVYTLEQQRYHEKYEAEKNKRLQKIKRLTAEKELIETNEEKTQKEIDTLTEINNELAYLNNLPAELNILTTIYRNTAPTYETESNDIPLEYPIHMRYIPYIKDGKIQEYAAVLEDGQLRTPHWQICHAQFDTKHNLIHELSKDNPWKSRSYVYNLEIPNYTKHLIIQNNIYDSYTHEYLGDYLRFHRDFLNFNLMPLYNCFSNRVCPKLDLEFKIANDNPYTAEFKTNDERYKIYMVPVKLFQKYTIAIDSSAAVEMCCGLFGQYQYKDPEKIYSDISKATYKCFNNMQFRTPVLFDKLCSEAFNFWTALNVTELAQHEDDLKLFIKVPADNKSSVVILEGDYTAYNDNIWLKKSSNPNIEDAPMTSVRCTNHTVINFEGDYEQLLDKLITPLQLLRTNTGVSYPFADRLIEYLVGNAITPYDEILDNVKRAKIVTAKNTHKDIAVLLEDGLWLPVMQAIYYTYMNEKHNTNDLNHDVLGFIDKDIEGLYSYKENEKAQPETIANINIYDEWED